MLVVAAVIIVTTVSAWITAFQMRRRIRNALGKTVKPEELTSIRTWMAVNEAEKQKPLDK
jgi:hypothetical protein